MQTKVVTAQSSSDEVAEGATRVGTGDERHEWAEAVRRAEAAAQRAEQGRREHEARREEVARKVDEALRQAEAAVQRAERLRREDDTRREEDDRRAALRAEETARRERQARAIARRLVVATVAASAVIGGLAGRVVYQLSRAPHDDAPAGARATRSTGVPGVDADSNADQALLPMPKGGVPGQSGAPCPEGIDELEGYCWIRYSLTATQVKSGVCETDAVYEPSAGWCRAHHAGYAPYRRPRRRINVVDP
jgi:hypothetical protein